MRGTALSWAASEQWESIHPLAILLILRGSQGEWCSLLIWVLQKCRSPSSLQREDSSVEPWGPTNGNNSIVEYSKEFNYKLIEIIFQFSSAVYSYESSFRSFFLSLSKNVHVHNKKNIIIQFLWPSIWHLLSYISYTQHNKWVSVSIEQKACLPWMTNSYCTENCGGANTSCSVMKLSNTSPINYWHSETATVHSR